jgi:ABC-type phosphate transport system auxiliary subunit
MRSFEAAGLSRQQAEALTRTVTAVVTAAKEDQAGAYVTKGSLQTALLERDARVASFRAETGKAAELQAAALTRDTERLGAALDRVRAELRAEVDKATAAQRLDLNLERARLRDDLQAVRDKASELEVKLDKETSALRALVEGTKNEMIKYSLGVLLTFSTIGLGVARILGMGK